MCKLASKIVTVLQFTRAIRKIKEDKAKLRLYLDISLLYITCISFIIIIISIIKIITTIIASSLTLEFENAFKRMQYVPEYNHAYFLFLFQVPRTIPRTAPAQPHAYTAHPMLSPSCPLPDARPFSGAVFLKC